MSALRSAILYIRGLQALVADCDAGRLGDSVYRTSLALDCSEEREAQRAARARKVANINSDTQTCCGVKINSKRLWREGFNVDVCCLDWSWQTG